MHNDRGQCDIINRIITLTKRSSDTIHEIIPTKYQKYPSNTILIHMNVLAKVNKSPWRRLLNMTPHDTYSIPIHVHTMNLTDINHKQKE